MNMTLAEMAKALGRPVVFLSGLQQRFDLPLIREGGYQPAYFTFLRYLHNLRLLQVSEEKLLALWRLELKILFLLQVDRESSPTWMLDHCQRHSHRSRRLFFSGFDLGVDLTRGGAQLQLDFNDHSQELFHGREMGEDLLSLIETYQRKIADMTAYIGEQRRFLRAAERWAQRRAKAAAKPEKSAKNHASRATG